MKGLRIVWVSLFVFDLSFNLGTMIILIGSHQPAYIVTWTEPLALFLTMTAPFVLGYLVGRDR